MPGRGDKNLGAARLFNRVLGMGAYAAGLITGNSYARFLGLREAAERALNRDDVEAAEARARELLELADQYRGDWNCGNGIHHGNIILGLCAARRGRVSQAKVHLHAAARCPGSPQLNSFGPNMRLAAVLLEQGMRDAVLDYLEACKELWECETTASHGRPIAGPARLDAWADEIRQGKIPDFGPNLAY
jgi:hypothetical protein